MRPYPTIPGRRPVLNHLSPIEKKLAKKKENEARLALKAAKAAKGAAAAPAGEPKKAKKEKEVKEEEPEFVNTTPKGDKKGASVRSLVRNPW